MKLKGAVLIAMFAGGLFGTIEKSESRVPFVRECAGKDIGQWAFGEGADGCDANRFGSVSRIKYVYADFVFDRSKSDDVEHRKDYVTNVNALLRDLASHYMKARRPDVQDDEVQAFVEAIRAVAHQETYWSHYRVAVRGGSGRAPAYGAATAIWWDGGALPHQCAVAGAGRSLAGLRRLCGDYFPRPLVPGSHRDAYPGV